MGFFDVIIGFIALGGLGIISLAGVAFNVIRRDYNQEKERLRLQMMIEERKLEEIRQENYLLENEDMRKELEEIKASRRLSANENAQKRWLIKETK
ncbi:hypothetical protein [Lacicoccus alkaliphilus]|uniref:Uncharacterized protein n=1 Tax=Lacicoccus alkaliphilus DSM 16010 TaxID=1123231 RepID=A0A1M7F6G2_9BACL|nr:hypothetical protein [Salinicoccus alkaliphilus]SHL99299.1 hypothetical protein SAMN02745189_01341 [Salinicoccus alkaliphilus DSM 16010]